MHAKVKTMQKETSTMTRRTSGRQQDSKKICKNLKAGDRLEGRKLRKVKSSKSKGKNNARTRKGFKKQHPVAGPGLSSALGPCVKMGKKCKGAAKGS